MPKAKTTYDDILEAETDLESLRRKYLLETGWENRCDYPGSFWLWEKKMPSGRTVAVNAATACRMQDWLDAQSKAQGSEQGKG